MDSRDASNGPPSASAPDALEIERTHISATKLAPPKLSALGRYVIVDFLGEGGMAKVYAAYDPELDRKVALKLLKVAGGDLDTARAFVQREAQAMARVSSPNVVSVFDAGTWEGQLFVAMEHVQGQTLRALLTEHRPPLREVLRLFIEAGQGLAAAHAAGLVHRDFKAENVLVGEDGRVRVSDFGLAHLDSRPLPIPHSAKSNASLRETLTGGLAGTPAYMSPEQFEAKPLDWRSDQFSFCASLWEALCGTLPFGDGTVETIRSAVLEGKLRPPGPAMPRWVARVLERGLSRDPARRYGSMGELLSLLRRDRRRKAQRVATGAALALVAVAGLGQVTWRYYQEETRCTRESQAALRGTWSSATRAQVAKGLQQTPGLDAEEELAELDRRLNAWLERRCAACRAAQADPAQAPTMDCLDRYLARAAAAAAVLQTPSSRPDSVEALLVDLGSPSRCERVQARASALDNALLREATQASTLVAQARFAEAAGQARAALALPHPASVEAASLRHSLGTAIWRSSGPTSEALEALHQAIRDADEAGADEVSVLARCVLSRALDAAGRHEEAEAVALDAGAWLRRLGSPPFLERSYDNLRGLLANQAQRHEEALFFYRRAIEAARLADPRSHFLAVGHNDLAFEFGSLGRHAEAASEYQAALSIYQSVRWRSPRSVAITWANLGSVRLNQGRNTEALQAFDEARQALASLGQQDEPDRLWIAELRARALVELGRLEEASAECGAVFAARSEAEESTLASALADRARVELAGGRLEAALADAQEGRRLAESTESDRYDLIHVRLTWARVAWEANKDRPHVLQVTRELLALLGPEDGELRKAIESWLEAVEPPK